MPANPPSKTAVFLGCMNAMFHPRSGARCRFHRLLLAFALGILSSAPLRAQSPPAPTWALTRAPLADWRAMASSADGSRLVAVQSIGHFGTAYGGIYTSIDSGATWSRSSVPARDWTGVASSADGLRLVAASAQAQIGDEWIAGAIYKSSDGGTNWIKTDAPPDQWSAVASSSDGIRLVAASTASEGEMGRFVPGLIYVSADAGLTWVRTAAPSRGWISVASSADGGRIVAAAARQDSTETPGALFVSKGDGGLTWEEAFRFEGGGDWSSVAMSADGRTVAATAQHVTRSDGSSQAGAVFFTSDILRPKGEVIWQEPEVPESFWSSVACSSDGIRLVAVAEDGVIATSVDAGTTWTLNNAPAYLWRTVASSADGTKLAAGAYQAPVGPGGNRQPQPIYTLGTPYRPWIIQEPFRRVVAPGEAVSFTVEAGGIPLTYQWQKDGTNLADGVNISGAQAAGLVISNVSPAEAGVYSVIVSNVLGRVSSEALLRLASWTRTSASSSAWVSVASSADGRFMVAGPDTSMTPAGQNLSGWLSISRDAGLTWEITDAYGNYDHSGWALAASADGSRLFAAQGDTGIYSSGDSGTTWQKTSAPTDRNQTWPVLVWKTLACSADGTKLVAACSAPNLFGPQVLPGEVYLSADAGTTWTNAHLGTNNWSSVASSADGTRLVAATGGELGKKEIGGAQFWVLNPGPIYLSSDSGTTWTKSGAPDGYWQSVACSADGSRIVAVQGRNEDWRFFNPIRIPGGIYVSADFGQTWSATAAPVRLWKSVAMSADGSRVATTCEVDDPPGGNQDPLHISTDAGQTWIAATVPAGKWPAVAMSADGNRMVAVANGGGIWLSPTTTSLNIPLNIARTAEGLELSWPATASVLALQRCSDLRAGYWSVISATPVSNGATQSVTLPLSNEHAFYRLFLP